MARPSTFEQRRREREFLGLVASGCAPSEAARRSRLSPERVLVLLADQEFRAALFGMLVAA